MINIPRGRLRITRESYCACVVIGRVRLAADYRITVDYLWIKLISWCACLARGLNKQKQTYKKPRDHRMD